MPAKAAPPPADNSPKKPGFFSGLATAAREISSEVNRARNNQLPTGLESGARATPAAASAPVAAGPSPLNLASFSLDAAPTVAGAEMTFALPADHFNDPVSTSQPAAVAAAPAVSLLTDPWPLLHDPERSHALQADAYFHPYTSADIDHYCQGESGVRGAAQGQGKQREVVTLLAVEAGETEMLNRMKQLFRSVPGVYGSVGFNPRNLQNDMDAMDDRLTELLNQNPNLIAVGPIGVDGNYSPSSLPQQADQLIRQLEIAADFDLPAIIFHNKAVAQLQQALNSTVLPKKLVWLKPVRHAEELELIQQTDAYVVLRAELTHPKEDFYQRAISHLLPQRLLIGSGNSLNAVHNKAGQFNSPASLPEILRVAANLLGMAPKALQARVNANFAHVYGPPV